MLSTTKKQFIKSRLRGYEKLKQCCGSGQESSQSDDVFPAVGIAWSRLPCSHRSASVAVVVVSSWSPREDRMGGSGVVTNQKRERTSDSSPSIHQQSHGMLGIRKGVDESVCCLAVRHFEDEFALLGKGKNPPKKKKLNQTKGVERRREWAFQRHADIYSYTILCDHSFNTSRHFYSANGF